VAGHRAAARRPRPRSQHFLRSPELAAGIVADASVCAEHLVLDIGAGTGRLTAELAKAARHVIAVELDAQLAARLRGRWPNVEVVEHDAAALAHPTVPLRVVANIPFDRTTDVLHHLLDDPSTPLERADLVVEWGVALKRGIPVPSSRNGVLWGATYDVRIARRLPASAFAPPPSTDAGILVFTRRERPLVGADRFAAYAHFVGLGFRLGLGAVASQRALRRLVPAGAQARDLDAHLWADLFHETNGLGAVGRASRKTVHSAHRPRR
jgi:16S rRNA A1518/A1519 N6-dimethyltransferase RsmA/KsgA/DIM1 with predicted DNA glycosylase/AP lyase activity